MRDSFQENDNNIRKECVILIISLIEIELKFRPLVIF